jgi:hypothetical protein
MLNSIKTETNSSFTKTKFEFPNHHKTQRNHEQSTTLPEKIAKQQIQEQVDRAFKDAFNLLVPLGVEKVLRKSNIITMKQVSQHIRNHFKKSSKKANFLIPMTIDKVIIQSDSDSDSEDTNNEEDKQNEMNLYDYDSEDEDDNAINLLEDTTNSRLKTTKGLCDTINPNSKESYFLVNIDGKKKYLHKNTAIWYLMDEKHKLSSDRLNRVMQN